MNVLLKHSFIFDIAGGLACVGYGLYKEDPWWWGGGLAGLAFSVVWKRLQPKLLAKFVKKAVPSPQSAPPVQGSNPLSDGELGEEAVPEEVAPQSAPLQRFHHSVSTFPLAPRKDGKLRYF